jgi:hypothetical protein
VSPEAQARRDTGRQEVPSRNLPLGSALRQALGHARQTAQLPRWSLAAGAASAAHLGWYLHSRGGRRYSWHGRWYTRQLLAAPVPRATLNFASIWAPGRAACMLCRATDLVLAVWSSEPPVPLLCERPARHPPGRLRPVGTSPDLLVLVAGTAWRLHLGRSGCPRDALFAGLRALTAAVDAPPAPGAGDELPASAHLRRAAPRPVRVPAQRIARAAARARLVLCLEPTSAPQHTADFGQLMQERRQDRWHGHSLQLVVSGDGRAGALLSHVNGFDGEAARGWLAELHHLARRSSPACQHPVPWRARVAPAATADPEDGPALVDLRGVGRDWLRSRGLGTDAALQLAMFLASIETLGCLPLQFEMVRSAHGAGDRIFLHRFAAAGLGPFLRALPGGDLARLFALLRAVSAEHRDALRAARADERAALYWDFLLGSLPALVYRRLRLPGHPVAAGEPDAPRRTVFTSALSLRPELPWTGRFLRAFPGCACTVHYSVGPALVRLLVTRGEFAPAPPLQFAAAIARHLQNLAVIAAGEEEAPDVLMEVVG